MGSKTLRLVMSALGALLSLALPACMAGAKDGAKDGHASLTGTAGDPAIEEPNSPTHNGLSARSLLSNAITLNPRALKILLDRPLNDALFDPQNQEYMSRQLFDANARDVMDYIVSCALDRSSRVRYVDPSSHAVQSWQGEMGLCKSWEHQKPSVACLRMVSSCLFARTNRLHRWVPA